MSNVATPHVGWKPIPRSLKVLSIVMVLWAIGSAMNLPTLMEKGLPVLGTFVFGTTALLTVVFLDFIGPLVFFYALWNRKRWGVPWAFFYIGLFLLNGGVALFTVVEQLGMTQIAIPNLVSMVFFAVIYWKRSYFAV